jgi:capsular exopolysaccharide synthesis family protein
LRAARLETVAQVARPAESAPSNDSWSASTPVPPAPTAPAARPKRATLRQTLRDVASRIRPERIALLDPTAPAAAASRRLAQQVKRQAGRRRMSSIVVTSPLGGDGKTTVSCNLAVSLARLDRSRTVVLVDLDLRRPRVAESLGLSVDVGVDELLAQKATLDEALMETDEPGLSVLASKWSSSSPEPLLASENLRRLLDALTRRFWMVVVDTPPVLAVADALSVLDIADGCLLVVRAGKSPTSSVEQAKEHLPADKMLGCCLNFARSARHNEGYYGYGPRLEGAEGAPGAARPGEPEVARARLGAEADAR